MVVISSPIFNNFDNITTCKTCTNHFNGIPEVNLLDSQAKTSIVKACQEFGFFKVVNHGISIEYISRLEVEAVKFFNLPQHEKDNLGPPNTFGYGSKKIGPNGDVGWVEYLLFSMNPEIRSKKAVNIFSENSEHIWSLVNDYTSAVRKMACRVLEMIADGLQIGPRNVLSSLLGEDKSDCLLRVNHYPPCPELQALSGRNVIGFGEHTDPQIISVMRSNNISGLQISLRDGTWVTVPADEYSFFINVGDALQVLTNGRFRSVKHRALANSLASRVSMIYFCGPPFNEKIAPLSSLMEDGEESLYKEFTWFEYKNSANNTRLGDNRLSRFEK